MADETTHGTGAEGARKTRRRRGAAEGQPEGVQPGAAGARTGTAQTGAAGSAASDAINPPREPEAPRTPRTPPDGGPRDQRNERDAAPEGAERREGQDQPRISRDQIRVLHELVEEVEGIRGRDATLPLLLGHFGVSDLTQVTSEDASQLIANLRSRLRDRRQLEQQQATQQAQQQPPPAGPPPGGPPQQPPPPPAVPPAPPVVPPVVPPVPPVGAVPPPPPPEVPPVQPVTPPPQQPPPPPQTGQFQIPAQIAAPVVALLGGGMPPQQPPPAGPPPGGPPQQPSPVVVQPPEVPPVPPAPPVVPPVVPPVNPPPPPVGPGFRVPRMPAGMMGGVFWILAIIVGGILVLGLVNRVIMPGVGSVWAWATATTVDSKKASTVLGKAQNAFKGAKEAHEATRLDTLSSGLAEADSELRGAQFATVKETAGYMAFFQESGRWVCTPGERPLKVGDRVYLYTPSRTMTPPPCPTSLFTSPMTWALLDEAAPNLYAGVRLAYVPYHVLDVGHAFTKRDDLDD